MNDRVRLTIEADLLLDGRGSPESSHLRNVYIEAPQGGTYAIPAAVITGFEAISPKPAEPQGLGAVVEDARGDFWVYTGLRNAKDGETRLWFRGSLPADYADIAAVKVLSEGIQS